MGIGCNSPNLARSEVRRFRSRFSGAIWPSAGLTSGQETKPVKRQCCGFRSRLEP
jgi:hypothetical protein